MLPGTVQLLLRLDREVHRDVTSTSTDWPFSFADEMLAWQTQELLGHEMGRDEHTVYVEPRLVVEVAFNEIQKSSRYPGGLALRFARVKRYRTDKSPVEADTLETVRALGAP